MITPLLRSFCFILSLAFFAPAQAQTSASDDTFFEWMASYYLHPEPERISGMLDYFENSDVLTGKDEPARVGARSAIAGFLAGVFQAHPEKIEPWYKSVLQKADTPAIRRLRSIFLSGLLLADTQEVNHARRKLFEQYPQDGKWAARFPLRAMAQMPDNENQWPWFLDTLWGNFFATGEAAPILQILSVAPFANMPKPEKPTYTDVFRFTYGHSARWSLISNARSHPRVLQICESVLETTQDEALAETLRDIIANAKERPD